MSECFDRYKEGWLKGDPDMVLGACAEDFVYDDPIDGRFTIAEMRAYLQSVPEGAVKVTEVVSEEHDGLETVWCWWAMGDQEGAALAKVGRHGVHWQKVTYYAPAAPLGAQPEQAGTTI
jgi:hypothetical protein